MPTSSEPPDRRAPSAQVVMKDFPGLNSYGNPHQIPAGSAVIQVNVASDVPGQLSVRGGTAVVRFDR